MKKFFKLIKFKGKWMLRKAKINKQRNIRKVPLKLYSLDRKTLMMSQPASQPSWL